MPGQMPFGYNNMPNINSFNPLEGYVNKISELEQRVSNLENKLKELSKSMYNSTNFDYQTSMHMM